jgi:hypothetical protein
MSEAASLTCQNRKNKVKKERKKSSSKIKPECASAQRRAELRSGAQRHTCHYCIVLNRALWTNTELILDQLKLSNQDMSCCKKMVLLSKLQLHTLQNFIMQWQRLLLENQTVEKYWPLSYINSRKACFLYYASLLESYHTAVKPGRTF